MKPTMSKKAIRRVTPEQASAIAKHLGGKPMNKKMHFTGKVAKSEPKATGSSVDTTGKVTPVTKPGW